MQMIHSLPRVHSLIDDEAVAAIELGSLGDLFRGVEKVLVVAMLGKRRDAGDFLARHDEHVHGGLGVRVFERHAMLVLIDDVGGDLSIDDLGEERGHRRRLD